jgi:hypothetical protein
MANTAFDHASALTIPGSTTNNGLVRWGDTSGTSFGNITGITSDGSNLTLLTRGEIRFSDADSTHFIAFESPATVGTSYTMTLPADLPAADEVLTVTSYSGGAGVLEWASAGGARTVSPTNVDNAVITFVDSGDTFAAEANLTFDGTDLTVGTGNVIIGTAGKGIDFSAQTGTGSGTVGSELLDHYEAGTFTPSITFGNNAASMTFDSRLGSYTRVGNRVHISGEVDMSAKGTSTGTALVTGLPFTIRNNGDSKGVIGMELRQISFADYPSLVLYEGGTSLGFDETTNAGVITVLTEGNFANNSVVFFSGAYQVA